jgi:2-C-methyl-D-erythritol 2,4-cyclodiphosphate synthase
MKAPRVGLGYDCHRLQNGGDCYLGGVLIDSPVSPIGHSDADVLLHAVCDAILGAAGLDDLGTQFSDKDEQWRDCRSTDFIKHCMQQLDEKIMSVASIDCVIICDEPKISPHRQKIREKLSSLLNLGIDRVNVKGKTTEGGDSERITVHAVALLVEA